MPVPAIFVFAETVLSIETNNLELASRFTSFVSGRL